MEKEDREELIDIGGGIFLTPQEMEEIKEAEEEIKRGEGIEARVAFEELMKRIEKNKNECHSSAWIL